MSETKLCPSCQEEVLSSNFLLHSLYCERNIIQCEQCDQKIDVNEKDLHMKEHEKIVCHYCQQSYEKRALLIHQSNCFNKPTQCSYCNLSFNKSEMTQHQVKCGARTEQCDICKKHIRKMEFEIHQTICREPSPKKQVSPKRHRLTRITSDGTSSESSDDASVKEVKTLKSKQQQQQQQQNVRRPPQRKPQPQKKQVQVEDDEDEEFQKALQLSLNQK